ncbi:hypothetical protein EG327_008086 [Venturia inaequalis]|uniref:Chlorophyllase n=1 Tax=Venturia inaequalis TaxID=5025 RepID=A0A8H3VVI1_VENIN|nr:hypothetical protein EG327_008086 [Venturia inaequalis]
MLNTHTLYFLLTIAPFALALAQAPSPPQAFPAKGDNGEMGGIFGMGQAMVAAGLPKGGFPNGPEFPKPGPRFTNGGSGPYKAWYTTDPGLPQHTIFAPKAAPPTGVKVPVIVWGNGGCMASGTMFSDFLTEIASYGYLVLANGNPAANTTTTAPTGAEINPLAGLLAAAGRGISKVQMLTDSIDWVTKGNAAKFGDIDIAHLAAAGQSCGGLEGKSILSSYATSYHDDRVKLTVLFNSGVIDPAKKYLLKELKAPVAYFLGGPLDIAYPNGEADYPLLPEGLPSVKVSLDSGHMGTYGATGGGKFGKAAVAFFEWQFRGDAKAKAKFTDPASEGSLVKDNWNVTMKGF